METTAIELLKAGAHAIQLPNGTRITRSAAGQYEVRCDNASLPYSDYIDAIEWAELYSNHRHGDHIVCTHWTRVE